MEPSQGNAASGLVIVVFKTNSNKTTLAFILDPEGARVRKVGTLHPSMLSHFVVCVGSGFFRQKEDSDHQCAVHILAVCHWIKGTPLVTSAFY